MKSMSLATYPLIAHKICDYIISHIVSGNYAPLIVIGLILIAVIIVGTVALIRYEKSK